MRKPANINTIWVQQIIVDRGLERFINNTEKIIKQHINIKQTNTVKQVIKRNRLLLEYLISLKSNNERK